MHEWSPRVCLKLSLLRGDALAPYSLNRIVCVSKRNLFARWVYLISNASIHVSSWDARKRSLVMPRALLEVEFAPWQCALLTLTNHVYSGMLPSAIRSQDTHTLCRMYRFTFLHGTRKSDFCVLTMSTACGRMFIIYPCFCSHLTLDPGTCRSVHTPSKLYGLP